MSHDHTAGAAVRPDVELAFRIATLQGVRSLPDQTPEQIADLDAQIAALKAEQAREPFTFDDLFAQVQAQEAMLLAMGCTIDAVCQGIACALGEGEADAFEENAAVIESWPETFEGDPPSVIAYRKHGHTVAAGILRDMAAVIRAGTDAKARMVAASTGVQ